MIDQTHISRKEKCTGKDIGREKNGRGQDFGGFKKIILNIWSLILYKSLNSFFWADMLGSYGVSEQVFWQR